MIEGKLVNIKAIEDHHLFQLHEWSNEPTLWHWLGGWHFPYSEKSLDLWYNKIQGDPNNKHFVIEDKIKNEIIGTTNLVDIDWKNNHAFTGMLLGNKDYIGQGYAVDSIMAIMRYAFDELHFERLDGDLIEYNEASYKLYCEKCGWKEEGRRKSWFYRHGRYWDKIIVGVCRSDYYELVKTTKYWEDQ